MLLRNDIFARLLLLILAEHIWLGNTGWILQLAFKYNSLYVWKSPCFFFIDEIYNKKQEYSSKYVWGVETFWLRWWSSRALLQWLCLIFFLSSLLSEVATTIASFVLSCWVTICCYGLNFKVIHNKFGSNLNHGFAWA